MSLTISDFYVGKDTTGADVLCVTNKSPLLVFFYSCTCKTCKVLIDSLRSGTKKGYSFGDISLKENPKLLLLSEATTMPLQVDDIILFVGGVPHKRYIGSFSISAIENDIADTILTLQGIDSHSVGKPKTDSGKYKTFESAYGTQPKIIPSWDLYKKIGQVAEEHKQPPDTKKPSPSGICVACSKSHALIECDNDCGTIVCNDTEFYLEEDGTIKIGHNPKCGKSAKIDKTIYVPFTGTSGSHPEKVKSGKYKTFDEAYGKEEPKQERKILGTCKWNPQGEHVYTKEEILNLKKDWVIPQVPKGITHKVPHVKLWGTMSRKDMEELEAQGFHFESCSEKDNDPNVYIWSVSWTSADIQEGYKRAQEIITKENTYTREDLLKMREKDKYYHGSPYRLEDGEEPELYYGSGGCKVSGWLPLSDYEYLTNNEDFVIKYSIFKDDNVWIYEVIWDSESDVYTKDEILAMLDREEIPPLDADEEVILDGFVSKKDYDDLVNIGLVAEMDEKRSNKDRVYLLDVKWDDDKMPPLEPIKLNKLIHDARCLEEEHDKTLLEPIGHNVTFKQCGNCEAMLCNGKVYKDGVLVPHVCCGNSTHDTPPVQSAAIGYPNCPVCKKSCHPYIPCGNCKAILCEGKPYHQEQNGEYVYGHCLTCEVFLNLARDYGDVRTALAHEIDIPPSVGIPVKTTSNHATFDKAYNVKYNTSEEKKVISEFDKQVKENARKKRIEDKIRHCGVYSVCPVCSKEGCARMCPLGCSTRYCGTVEFYPDIVSNTFIVEHDPDCEFVCGSLTSEDSKEFSPFYSLLVLETPEERTKKIENIEKYNKAILEQKEKPKSEAKYSTFASAYSKVDEKREADEKIKFFPDMQNPSGTRASKNENITELARSLAKDAESVLEKAPQQSRFNLEQKMAMSSGFSPLKHSTISEDGNVVVGKTPSDTSNNTFVGNASGTAPPNNNTFIGTQPQNDTRIVEVGIRGSGRGNKSILANIPQILKKADDCIAKNEEYLAQQEKDDLVEKSNELLHTAICLKKEADRIVSKPQLSDTKEPIPQIITETLKLEQEAKRNELLHTAICMQKKVQQLNDVLEPDFKSEVVFEQVIEEKPKEHKEEIVVKEESKLVTEQVIEESEESEEDEGFQKAKPKRKNKRQRMKARKEKEAQLP